MERFLFRIATEKDYNDVFVKWWNDWTFLPPPVDCLPKTGVIVSDESEDLYGGFLYLTDGNIGWLEWVVSNKSVSVNRKRGALGFLVDVVSDIAKKNGMKLMFTSTVLPTFRNGLLKCGFLEGDKGIYQFVKCL